MDGYLLDTTAASILWDARHPDYDRIKAFFESIASSPVWISVIVLGEIEYGLKTAPSMDISRQDDVRVEMARFTLVLDIDKHTLAPYSDLRSELFKKYSPRNRRGRLTAKWPEELSERTNAKELGVQENDIWLASQAIQYNLILVTEDRMSRLAEVSSALSYSLQIAKWR